jgi:hypothetical protein
VAGWEGDVSDEWHAEQRAFYERFEEALEAAFWSFDSASNRMTLRDAFKAQVRALFFMLAPREKSADAERLAVMRRLVELDALTNRVHDETEIELDQMRGAPTGPQRAGSGA